MYLVLIVIFLGFITSPTRPRISSTRIPVRSTANVDGELGNVVCPVMCSDLGVGLDTVGIRLVNGIGMVFACLYRRITRSKLLGYLRDELIIIRCLILRNLEEGLAVDDDGGCKIICS
jgi:hypothetical protein